jgi:hypothetical protein
MTKTKKQQKKTTGKSPNKKSSSMASIAKSVIQTGGPILAKALLGMAMGGIPFPTSGARAIAAPDPGSVMQLSAPSANGAMVRTTKAKTANTKNGIRVTHREYIMDVVHSVADEFELLEFENINPVNGSLFPWLSTIATRFETYRFERLRFIYEPQTATTALGTVMMVVDYDANDLPPQDKTQMMSYKGAVRSPAWFACCNESDKSDLQKQKNYYTENTLAAGTFSDGRLSNVGKFVLAFQSESAAYTAGELYVEYDIHLDTPQLQNDSTPSKGIPWNNLVANGTAVADLTGPKDLPPFGTLDVNGIVDSSGNSYLEFNVAGYFLLNQLCDPLTTVAGTGEILWSVTVPTGSLAVIKQLVNTVFFQETNGINQGISACVAIFIPTPGELIQLNLDYTGMTSQTFNNIWSFVTPIDPSGLPSFAQFPDTASVALKLRSLRLLEKRRAAMHPPTSNSNSPMKSYKVVSRLVERDVNVSARNSRRISLERK